MCTTVQTLYVDSTKHIRLCSHVMTLVHIRCRTTPLEVTDFTQ